MNVSARPATRAGGLLAAVGLAASGGYLIASRTAGNGAATTNPAAENFS